MYADLHIHTSASDGCLSPAEVVNVAKDLGLDAVAITDHDTMEGVPEALQEGESLGLEVIPGVELSADYHGQEVHILGYYADYGCREFSRLLSKLRENRRHRVTKMVKKLNGMGLSLEVEEVMGLAGGKAVGRPHVAHALTQKGYAQDIKDAFDRYIGYQAPAYVARCRISPGKVITEVLNARGIPVLAHPGILKKDDIIPGLVEKGLLGLEVYHPGHSEGDIRRYLEMVSRYKLLVTGGSDCHGVDRMSGSEIGSVTLPMYHVEKLRGAAARIKA